MGVNALGFEHFMPCFKHAWDIAFTKKLNLDGWRIEGTIPFTRYQLWKFRGAPPPDSENLSSFAWISSEASNRTSVALLHPASSSGLYGVGML
jgi:hypothetical protein